MLLVMRSTHPRPPLPHLPPKAASLLPRAPSSLLAAPPAFRETSSLGLVAPQSRCRAPSGCCHYREEIPREEAACPPPVSFDAPRWTACSAEKRPPWSPSAPVCLPIRCDPTIALARGHQSFHLRKSCASHSNRLPPPVQWCAAAARHERACDQGNTLRSEGRPARRASNLAVSSPLRRQRIWKQQRP